MIKGQFSAKDLAVIVYEAIENETMLNKKTLVPLIEALVKAYTGINGKVVYNKKQQGQQKAILLSDFEKKFWHRVVKEMVPEKMDDFYSKIDEEKKLFEINNPQLK